MTTDTTMMISNGTTTAFADAKLQAITTEIMTLGKSIKNYWYKIAYLVAMADRLKCYQKDGFASTHEWVEKTFGLKRAAAYQLLTIGRDYTTEILSESGVVIGYRTNLTEAGQDDFSKAQVTLMLSLGHDTAKALVDDGIITPDMSTREMRKAIKAYKDSLVDVDDDELEDVDVDSDTADNGQDTVTKDKSDEKSDKDDCVLVIDDKGQEYRIPKAVLKLYKVK